MKSLFLCLVLLASFLPANSQSFRTPEGDFMDTVRRVNPRCNCTKNISYYYNIGGKYPKNSASLLEEVKKNSCFPKGKASASGYITFRCIIDCEGRADRRVEVLQTDEVYRKYAFPQELVDCLYNFFAGLDQWKPARIPYPDSDSTCYFNYNTFISFKIKNGKVVNVIP